MCATPLAQCSMQALSLAYVRVVGQQAVAVADVGCALPLFVLQGFVAVEALFNLINRDVLGCLVALAMLAIIPTCGWYVM